MEKIHVSHMKCVVSTKGLLVVDRIGVGVGVVLYSPQHRTAAGLHILAPLSRRPAPSNPAKFANTAIPHALYKLQELGVEAPTSIAIAGGGEIRNGAPAMNIGPSIVAAVRSAMERARLKVKLEEVGGMKFRKIVLNIDAGRIKIA